MLEVVTKFAACFNAGQPLRQMALATDEMVSRDMFSSIREARPDQLRARVEGVYAGYMFPDGRLGGVFVSSTVAEFAPLQAGFMFFKSVDGRWLVDDVPPSGVVVQVPS